MNIIIAVLLFFSCLGAMDECIGGKLGVKDAFQNGLRAMGSLSVAMCGIYCAVSVISEQLSSEMAAGSGKFLWDPSVFPAMFLATDMGGWALAKELAQTPEMAAYSGFLVASTLGCMMSFVLPVSLGSLPHYQILGFMQGIIWGMAALPAGLLAGGLVLGISWKILCINLIPVFVLCAVLLVLLRWMPRICLLGLTVFGNLVKITGILLSIWLAAGLFLPQFAIYPAERVQESLVVVFKITAVVCGACVASKILLIKARSCIEKACQKWNVNEYTILGMTANLVSHVSMLSFYEKMDVRGKVMNAAMAASGAFVMGGQLAFVSSQALNPKTVGAFLVCKMVSEILAVGLAAAFTKNTDHVK